MRPRVRLPFAATLVALLLVALPAWGAESDSEVPWERLYEEQGVVVYVQEVPGRTMPTFRGEGLVEASILDILAMFQDGTRHSKWMHANRSSRMLKRFGELEAWVYNRTAVPWPFQDRDVVLHAQLSFDIDKREAWNRFESITPPEHPPLKGVVRMPFLQGYYHLIYVSKNSTVLVYQVNADPGGLLPRWLARLATRNLPLKTILSIRKQVAETQGMYNDLITTWIKKYNLDIEAP